MKDKIKLDEIQILPKRKSYPIFIPTVPCDDSGHGPTIRQAAILYAVIISLVILAFNLL